MGWGVVRKRKRKVRSVRSPLRWATQVWPEEVSRPPQSSQPVGKWLPCQCVKTHTGAEEKQTDLLSSERSQCMKGVRSQPAEMTCPVHDQLFIFPDANKPYLWKNIQAGGKQSGSAGFLRPGTFPPTDKMLLFFFLRSRYLLFLLVLFGQHVDPWSILTRGQVPTCDGCQSMG